MAIGDSFGPNGAFTVVQMLPAVVRITGPLSEAYISSTLFAAASYPVERSPFRRAPSDPSLILIELDELKPEWQPYFRAATPTPTPAQGTEIPLLVSLQLNAIASETQFLRQLYRQSNASLLSAARRLLATVPEEDVARYVVRKRNLLKAEIRAKGPALFRRIAEWRNIREYGDPIGPSYGQLRTGQRGPGQPPRPPKTNAGIIAGVAETSGAFNLGARVLRLASLTLNVASFVLVATQNSPAALEPLPQSEEGQVETERARLRLGIPANANIDRHGHLKSTSYLQIDPMDFGHVGGEIDQETEEIFWALGLSVDYTFEGVHWSVPGYRF